MVKINLNSIKYDSVVDGPGLRAVVFMQGCEHRCKGCHNQSSWSLKDNNVVEINNLFNDIKLNTPTKKITISGGEPFLQPKALLQLTNLLKEEKFNIYTYTGFLYEDLIKDDMKKKILLNIDVLIDGKYEENNKDTSLSIVGSTNQRIIKLKNGEMMLDN